MHNNIEGSVFSHRSTNLYQVGIRGLSVVQTLRVLSFSVNFLSLRIRQNVVNISQVSAVTYPDDR